jgi:hypothetical protein
LPEYVRQKYLSVGARYPEVSIMSDTPNLTWLVDRRSKIQSFLLQLYTFDEKRSANAALFQLLVGTAFSLWRAVFLVYPDRQEPKAEKHAQDFLKLLIRDNAINYPQDRAAHAWTVGYYLNNAYFRLHLAYQKLVGNSQGGATFDTASKMTVDTFLQEQVADTPSSSRTNTEEQWDKAYDAAPASLSAIPFHSC